MEPPSSITEKERYEIEFEFVQNLANVGYLQFLAQEKLLEDVAFLRFLTYLRYWKQPKYLVQLRFPQCLAFLDALIDNPEFRKVMFGRVLFLRRAFNA
jgi:mediator of RNA polymerase II transcription subunit 31